MAATVQACGADAMSRGGPGWWRLLKAIVGFVFRLLVLLLTGTWLRGSRTGEATSDDETLSDSGVEPGAGTAPAGATSVQPDPASAAKRERDELRQRLRALEGQIRRLGQAGGLANAALAVRRDLDRGPPAPGLRAAQDHVRALSAAVSLLEAAAEQRAKPGAASWMANVDELAADLPLPVVDLLRAHGDPEARHWVGFEGRLQERELRWMMGSPVGALAVPHEWAEAPARWPFLVAAVARGLWFDVPGLAAEVMHTHAFPAGAPLPHSHFGYGPEELHGAQGAWLETLFADVYSTLRLGPAYPRALMEVLAEPGAPARVYAASARSGWVSPVPPGAARMHVSMRALEVLGLHREREALWDTWVDSSGESENFFFPTQDGTWNAIPAAYVLGELDALVRTLTTEPLEALYGYAFDEVPGLPFGPAEVASQARLREQLPHGRGEAHAPFVVLAAAAEAVAVDGAPAPPVARAARRLLSRGQVTPLPAGEQGASASARSPAARPPSSDVRDLARALRDPALVRDAIILGAALGSKGQGAAKTPRHPSGMWPRRRPS